MLDALTTRQLASLADVTDFQLVKATSAMDRWSSGHVGFRHRGDRALRGRSHVDRSIVAPLAFVQTNVMGTATLLDRARKAGVKRFVHVSTDEVYGDLGPDDPAFTERTPIAPRSPYRRPRRDRITWCGRTSRPPFPGVDYALLEQLRAVSISREAHPLMILNALSDTPLPVYGNGLNVRDWITSKITARPSSACWTRGARVRSTTSAGGRSGRTCTSCARS